jgi:hypothetical protein
MVNDVNIGAIKAATIAEEYLKSVFRIGYEFNINNINRETAECCPHCIDEDYSAVKHYVWIVTYYVTNLFSNTTKPYKLTIATTGSIQKIEPEIDKSHFAVERDKGLPQVFKKRNIKYRLHYIRTSLVGSELELPEGAQVVEMNYIMDYGSRCQSIGSQDRLIMYGILRDIYNEDPRMKCFEECAPYEKLLIKSLPLPGGEIKIEYKVLVPIGVAVP